MAEGITAHVVSAGTEQASTAVVLSGTGGLSVAALCIYFLKTSAATPSSVPSPTRLGPQQARFLSLFENAIKNHGGCVGGAIFVDGERVVRQGG